MAEVSANRGQYDAALHLQYQNSLMSYEYRNAVLPGFKVWWNGLNDLMKIHLAGHPSRSNGIQQEVYPLVESHLTTFADPVEIKQKKEFFDCRSNVIIDSGAFTAFTKGVNIDPLDYARWAIDFRQEWTPRTKSLYFMNFDVIGDQDASWVNQKKVEVAGLDVLPIVTRGADLKHIERAMAEYPYFALGGLVPISRQRSEMKAWLDRCFSVIIPSFKKDGIMPRVHLLGITQDWILQRYPCYSSDSSSWVSCLRFGGGDAAGLKQLPRYKESDAALSATIHTLKAEIRKYKKMQDDATNLWTKRGVIFID